MAATSEHVKVRATAPTLRPYQHAAFGGVVHELDQLGRRSTLVVSATGTGKTVTFAALARYWTSHGEPTLIVVHRDELIRQAARKCHDVGLWPSVECGSERADLTAKVVIASVQTLRGKRLERWAADYFRRVIVDEAHHSVAPGYRGILDRFCNAKIVGFTATPDRADGIGLGEVYESVAFRYEIREAIAAGYLVPIVARNVVIDAVKLDEIAMRAGDFAQDQLAAAMGSERAVRGQVVALLELAHHRPTIAFCADVAHARSVAQMLNDYRPGCARSVDGTTSDEDRERILGDYVAGRFQFLTNCDVLTEGFDAPTCSCVAILRPTKSRGRYVQAAGRGLRMLGDSIAQSIAAGKPDCLLLNITGSTLKHRLVGPVDCLVGVGELPDDVRDELERKLSTASLELDKAIDLAIVDTSRQRAELKRIALVAYHTEAIDPYIGPEQGAPPDCSPLWETQPPSLKQIAALDKLGIATGKLPASFTRADAWRLLARIQGHNAAHPASYATLRRLRIGGIRNPRALSGPRARQLLHKLRVHGWKAGTLSHEPENELDERASAQGAA